MPPLSRAALVVVIAALAAAASGPADPVQHGKSRDTARVGAHARPKALFWFDSHPCFPPRAEWKPGDTPAALAKEMRYTNMRGRPGSPAHYRKLKALGFDAVGLPGLDSAFPEFDPDSGDPANLDRVQQTRNARYYIRWAREAGLDVYLNVQFTATPVPDGFLWQEDNYAKVLDGVRRVARFARRTGCTGLIFDFEPYTPSLHRLWDLALWRERMKLERQQALEGLRQRGAEFAGAIAAEFPACVLHVYGVGNGYFAAGPEDFTDVNGYFLAGLSEARLLGGVHLDVANTYYRYMAGWVRDIYQQDALPLLQKAEQVSRAPDYTRAQCTIALGSAAIHRWHSGDGMYDRAVYRLTPEAYAAHLVALLRHSPRFIWIAGEASFDWTVPEISKDVDDDPYHLWGLDIPFASMSERSRKLGRTFSRVMRLPPRETEAHYRQALRDEERQDAALRRMVPRATVALLGSKEEYLEFDNNEELRYRRLWQLPVYPQIDLARLTADLDRADVVMTCVSPVWADRADEEFIARPRELPEPPKWRSFLERGGVLVVADYGTNPNARRWLAQIAPELALPAGPGACAPNQRAAWSDRDDPVARQPFRLRFFTCGQHVECAPADARGWTVLAKCAHGKPIYLVRRFGRGLVAVLMSSKFQVGFGCEHIANLLRARARGAESAEIPTQRR